MRDRTIRDLADVVDCEHKTAPEADEGTRYAFSVGTPALRGLGIDFASAKPVDEATYQAWSRRAELQAGDVILAREAPVGGVGFVDGHERVCLGQRTVLIRATPGKLHPRFLYYSLRAPEQRDWMSARSEGSTVPHLNVGDIREMPVAFIPPIEEQRRIAAVLGALDDLIDTNTRLATSADELAMELAASAPASVPLERVGSLVKSKTAMPMGVVDHFSLPAFDAEGLPERVDGAAIKSGKQTIATDAVLVSRLNPRIPRIWLAVPDTTVPAVASTEFAVLRPSEVAVEELWATCATREFTDQLASRVTGTTGSHQRVDKSAVASLLVRDPRSLSHSIRAAIVGLVQEAVACRLDAAQARGTRDKLLPLLLSGTVSPGEVEVGAA